MPCWMCTNSIKARKENKVGHLQLFHLEHEQSTCSQKIHISVVLWCYGVLVVTAAQLHLAKPELRFCAVQNPAHGMSEIRDGEDL